MSSFSKKENGTAGNQNSEVNANLHLEGGMRSVVPNLSAKGQMSSRRSLKRVLVSACTIMLVVAAGVFYACKKDDVVNQTNSLKQTKVWEAFDFNVVSPIGTIAVQEGEMPCTRSFVKRFWNPDKQRYTAFSHTTEVHNCAATGGILTSVEFIAELRNVLVTDFTDINNFILRVDGQEVVPGFSYEKSYAYDVIQDNGEVITMTGLFHITYDNVVNVWSEINQRMDWGTGNQTPQSRHWTEATTFDLSQFNTLSGISIGEFHNNYLDVLANSSLFPNQTAYNQYDLLYANLTPKMRSDLDKASIPENVIGGIVNIGLQMNGFDGLIDYFYNNYPNVIPYLEQMKTHFNDDMPNNVLNGEIENSLAFFLAMRTDVINSLSGQERALMLGTIEIAAYSSVYWYNVMWTDAGGSPWHPFFIDDEDDDGFLMMAKAPGPFVNFLIKCGKAIVKVCAVVTTDVTCFAVGFTAGFTIAGGPVTAPASIAVGGAAGTACAGAGSGVVGAALKDW